ncbi:hypothetical protein RHS04_08784 [Rhizoctonia solani]|uniref:Uncharacterized protein n=1 Tax=Rhizoctonia solani TaxID=456999 RepID=A0A8H7LG96_9AGAM|nr:hypothetical protein RHS04_08784 [Rhizoctonia solani]
MTHLISTLSLRSPVDLRTTRGNTNKQPTPQNHSAPAWHRDRRHDLSIPPIEPQRLNQIAHATVAPAARGRRALCPRRNHLSERITRDFVPMRFAIVSVSVLAALSQLVSAVPTLERRASATEKPTIGYAAQGG